jgi:putative transcriptional regulator
MDSLQGNLLVASPRLPDANFYRSVVFMIEHQEDGALGLVLNRVSGQSLKEVWQAACDSPCHSDQQLHVGGPVGGPLMALHSHPELEGHEIVRRVFFSSERDVLEALVGQTDHPYRIFSGYAGWGSGQLEGEMRVGGWLTAAARWRHIFGDDHEVLWRDVVNSIGAEITRDVLNIRNLPQDPQNN